MKYVEITKELFDSIIKNASSKNMEITHVCSTEKQIEIGKKIHIEKQLDLTFTIKGVQLLSRSQDGCRNYYIYDINS